MMKLGIIGTGFMAKTHADAYKKLVGVEIVGFTGVNVERGRKVAQEYGSEFFPSIEAMLARKEIQIIDVCTPTDLHERFVIQSAEAGKHILCEKPFALSLEAADRMIEAVQKAGVKLMVSQVLRFWPEYVKVKEMYDSGSLGEINMIYANRLTQHPNWGNWYKDVKKSGGGLFDLHLHDIDFMLHLLGPVDHVYSIGKKSANGAWNHVFSNLSFKNGSKACVESSYQMPHGYPFSMSLRVVTDEAAMEYNFTAGFNLEDLDSSKSSLKYFQSRQNPIQVEVESKDPYYEELRYFVDCVIKDQEPKIVTLQESREVLRIIVALEQSLETGQLVRV